MTNIPNCTLRFDEKAASVKFQFTDFSVKSSWEVHRIIKSQKDVVFYGCMPAEDVVAEFIGWTAAMTLVAY